MLLSELQRHFPNQKITSFLLSYYFDKSSAHWLLPVIHRPRFEAYYRTFSSGPLPPPIEFVALLSITCATALQFLPETDEDVRSPASHLMCKHIVNIQKAVIFASYPSGRQALEQRLVDFSRSVLFTCSEYPLSSLERIQALALFAVYQWVGQTRSACPAPGVEPLNRTRRMLESAGISLPSPFEWRRHVWRRNSRIFLCNDRSRSFIEPRWHYHLADAA